MVNNKDNRVFMARNYRSDSCPLEISLLGKKNKKEKGNINPLNAISIVYFLQAPLFTEKFSRTTTIHPGIFRGRALWADSCPLEI